MQIVIDIDDAEYEIIKAYTAPMTWAEHLIAKGKTLPKGHGRLIDADELKKEYPHNTDWEYPVNTNCYVVESIDKLPTIVEADKEE